VTTTRHGRTGRGTRVVDHEARGTRHQASGHEARGHEARDTRRVARDTRHRDTRHDAPDTRHQTRCTRHETRSTRHESARDHTSREQTSTREWLRAAYPLAQCIDPAPWSADALLMHERAHQLDQGMGELLIEGRRAHIGVCSTRRPAPSACTEHGMQRVGVHGESRACAHCSPEILVMWLRRVRSRDIEMTLVGWKGEPSPSRSSSSVGRTARRKSSSSRKPSGMRSLTPNTHTSPMSSAAWLRIATAWRSRTWVGLSAR
jgi:hypothetical protein